PTPPPAPAAPAVVASLAARAATASRRQCRGCRGRGGPASRSVQSGGPARRSPHPTSRRRADAGSHAPRNRSTSSGARRTERARRATAGPSDSLRAQTAIALARQRFHHTLQLEVEQGGQQYPGPDAGLPHECVHVLGGRLQGAVDRLLGGIEERQRGWIRRPFQPWPGRRRGYPFQLLQYLLHAGDGASAVADELV